MKHSVERIKLKNKVEGLFIDVPSASVMAVNLDFRAGDFLSPEGKWDVAHTLEHMVLGANKYYPEARLFNAEFQKNGAYINASTGAFSLQYITEFADFEWERALDLLIKSITTPLLKQSEFRAEKGNVREELVGNLNAHYRQLTVRSLMKFGLIALNDAERIKQLRKIKLEDIQRHYKNTHTTDNLHFAIAGNLTRRKSTIAEMLESIRLPRGERFEIPIEEIRPYENYYYIDEPGINNLYFQWYTFAKKNYTIRETLALGMANNILTGTLHSKILGKARSRGLIYGMRSSFEKYRDKMGWKLGSEILPKNSLRFFDIMTEEIAKLKKGNVKLSDIEAAKQYGLGTFQRANQTVGSILDLYADEFFLDDKIINFNTIPGRLQQITKEEVISAFSRIFEDKLWGLSIMGSNQQPLVEKLYANLKTLWD